MLLCKAFCEIQPLYLKIESEVFNILDHLSHVSLKKRLFLYISLACIFTVSHIVNVQMD